MAQNPFDDEPATPDRPPNPFGEKDDAALGPDAAARRITQAARSIRGLRGRLGAEGLPPAAMRQLLDEIAGALDAVARGFREPPED